MLWSIKEKTVLTTSRPEGKEWLVQQKLGRLGYYDHYYNILAAQIWAHKIYHWRRKAYYCHHLLLSHCTKNIWEGGVWKFLYAIKLIISWSAVIVQAMVILQRCVCCREEEDKELYTATRYRCHKAYQDWPDKILEHNRLCEICATDPRHPYKKRVTNDCIGHCRIHGQHAGGPSAEWIWLTVTLNCWIITSILHNVV